MAASFGMEEVILFGPLSLQNKVGILEEASNTSAFPHTKQRRNPGAITTACRVFRTVFGFLKSPLEDSSKADP
jgi:hypothetical protein